MQHIIVTRGEELPTIQQEYFVVKYIKEVETIDGEKIDVVDQDRIELVTVAGLESQKELLLVQLEMVEAKLAEIAKL